MGIHYMTPIFMARNKDRQDEMIECLEKNLQNIGVEKLILFVEGKKTLELVEKYRDNPKLELILVNKQFTYKDFFVYAQEKLQGKICCIGFADTLLVRGFEKITYKSLKKHIFSISRHNLDCATQTGLGCCKDNRCGVYKNGKFWVGGGNGCNCVCIPIKQ